MHELVRIAPSGGAEHLYEIGRIIIAGIYGGDLSAWRDKGKKSASLRALCRREDLPFSPSTIHRGLSTYELVSRSGVSDWKHLSPSHFRAIHRAPPERRVELLRYACAVEVTPAALVRLGCAAWGQEDGDTPKRRGRPRTDPLVRAIRKLEKAIAEVRGLAREFERGTPIVAHENLAQVAAMLGELAGQMASTVEQRELERSTPACGSATRRSESGRIS